MQSRKTFILLAALRYVCGLAVVCTIGWFTDRTGWPVLVRSTIDVIVIGLVVAVVAAKPLSYSIYAERERLRGDAS